LAVPEPAPDDAAVASARDEATTALAHPCPCCGGRMIVIESFEAGCHPSTIRIDTS
jgi:hypothetical protein